MKRGEMQGEWRDEGKGNLIRHTDSSTYCSRTERGPNLASLCVPSPRWVVPGSGTGCAAENTTHQGVNSQTASGNGVDVAPRVWCASHFAVHASPLFSLSVEDIRCSARQPEKDSCKL